MTVTLAAGNPRRTRITNPKAAWKDDLKRGFRSPREFILAVSHDDPRNPRDERLKFLATAGSDEHGTFGDAYGGFLVPDGFSPGLLMVGVDADPTAGRTTQMPMEHPTLAIGARVDKDHSTSVSGGLTVTRRAEAAEANASRMELEKVKLVAHSLFGLSYATEELLDQSPSSFAAILEAGFREEFASRLLLEKLEGTGVGEFAGVLNSDCLLTIEKEEAQAAATIVYQNVLRMRSRCWGYNRAIWLCNHDCIPQLMLMNQAVGTGGVPVWQPSAREDHPDVLLGRPLFVHEYLPALGQPGDLLLGSWGEYLQGTYKPLQSAESIHVRFVEHERTFKFWMQNAGLPWWRTVLTPKNGPTQSPFVALEARE